MAIASTMQFLVFLIFMKRPSQQGTLHLLAKMLSCKNKKDGTGQIWENNVDHFVRHYDATVPPKLVQLLPEGHSCVFGLNALNLKTKQDGVDAFMATIGNSI